MSAQVQHQFIFLFLSFVWGMSLAWLYDWLHLLRYLFSHSRLLMNIEDLFYWLGVMMIVLRLIFTWHHGEIRSYIVLGIFGGAIFYIKWISPVYLAVTEFVLKPLKCILKAFVGILRKMHRKSSDND